MPRPKSKNELLQQGEENFQKLNAFIESFSEEEQLTDFPKGTMNRNIRDVLAHLHQWHLMMLDWYEVGMRGEKPNMPASGYTWKTVPDLNRKIWEEYQNVPLKEVKQLLKKSYGEVRQLIHQHSDTELFTKKKYKWTGSTSLGAYLISATSSHYDWGYKLIKRIKKYLLIIALKKIYDFSTYINFFYKR